MTTTPTSSTAAPAATGRDSDQLSIRLPEGMRETLKAGAAMHRRTLNAEVVAIIEAGMLLPTTAGGIPGLAAAAPGTSTTSAPIPTHVKQYKSVFGEWIRDARIRAGLTQNKLANRVGVSQSAIDDWEYGNVVPRTRNVELLIAALGPLTMDGESITNIPAGAASAPTPDAADFTQLSKRALALAQTLGIEIVGNAAGFNAFSDGEIISSDCSAVEIEKWLDGYLVSQIDAAVKAREANASNRKKNLPNFAGIDAIVLVAANKLGMRVVDFDDNYGLNYRNDPIDEGMSADEISQFLQGFLIGVEHFNGLAMLDELSKAEQVIQVLAAVMDDAQKKKAAAALVGLGFDPAFPARDKERQALLTEARAQGAA